MVARDVVAISLTGISTLIRFNLGSIPSTAKIYNHHLGLKMQAVRFRYVCQPSFFLFFLVRLVEVGNE
jgi:hypothetical protein